jgi:hypothetical protein
VRYGVAAEVLLDKLLTAVRNRHSGQNILADETS